MNFDVVKIHQEECRCRPIKHKRPNRGDGFQLEQPPSALKSVERANFSQFMLLNQVVQPFVQGLASVAGPSVLRGVKSASFRTAPAAADTAAAPRPASVADEETMILRQEVEAMKIALAGLEARLAK